MTAPLVESGSRAQLRAVWCGAPDPERVVRVDRDWADGTTRFTYDDGRDPWVLRGIKPRRSE